MPIVIDTSVTMAWCFEDEATDKSDAVLDRLVHAEAVVPTLWHFELANVLSVAERQKRISEAQSARFLDLLSQLPIRTELSQLDSGALLAIGRRLRLSAYDAAYLVLAERIGAPLATLDATLARASKKAGVELVVDG